MNEKEKSTEITKTKEEILNQLYINANDLMILIPDLKYDNARKYINEIRKEMEDKKLWIPISSHHLALTKLVKKKFGL